MSKRKQKQNNEELCCICLDRIDDVTLATPCDICRNVIHDTCIIELIRQTTNYMSCPYCRHPLPAKFNIHIDTRNSHNFARPPERFVPYSSIRDTLVQMVNTSRLEAERSGNFTDSDSSSEEDEEEAFLALMRQLVQTPQEPIDPIQML